MLEFEDITYSIGNQENSTSILKGISGCFKKGELSAIMGPSGSGKTTFLNVISGQTHKKAYTGGNIKYDGQSFNYKICKKFAFLRQDDEYIPTMKVGSFLQMVGENYNPTKSKNEIRQEVINMLKVFYLQDKINNTMSGISGGERKRVLVVAEFLSNREIIILDEPTTGLDSHLAFKMMSTCKKICKERNIIMILTIHQPSAAIMEFFDTFMFIYEGNLVYLGEYKEFDSFLAKNNFKKPEGPINLAEYIFELSSDKSYDELITAQIPKFKVFASRIKKTSCDLQQSGSNVVYLSTQFNLRNVKNAFFVFLKYFISRKMNFVILFLPLILLLAISILCLQNMQSFHTNMLITDKITEEIREYLKKNKECNLGEKDNNFGIDINKCIFNMETKKYFADIQTKKYILDKIVNDLKIEKSTIKDKCPPDILKRICAEINEKYTSNEISDDDINDYFEGRIPNIDIISKNLSIEITKYLKDKNINNVNIDDKDIKNCIINGIEKYESKISLDAYFNKAIDEHFINFDLTKRSEKSDMVFFVFFATMIFILLFCDTVFKLLHKLLAEYPFLVQKSIFSTHEFVFVAFIIQSIIISIYSICIFLNLQYLDYKYAFYFMIFSYLVLTQHFFFTTILASWFLRFMKLILFLSGIPYLIGEDYDLNKKLKISNYANHILPARILTTELCKLLAISYKFSTDFLDEIFFIKFYHRIEVVVISIVFTLLGVWIMNYKYSLSCRTKLHK